VLRKNKPENVFDYTSLTRLHHPKDYLSFIHHLTSSQSKHAKK